MVCYAFRKLKSLNSEIKSKLKWHVQVKFCLVTSIADVYPSDYLALKHTFLY